MAPLEFRFLPASEQPSDSKRSRAAVAFGTDQLEDSMKIPAIALKNALHHFRRGLPISDVGPGNPKEKARC
jgi:hypothetical protein